MRLCTARMSSDENVASLFRQPRPLSPHWTTHSICRTRQSFPRWNSLFVWICFPRNRWRTGVGPLSRPDQHMGCRIARLVLGGLGVSAMWVVEIAVYSSLPAVRTIPLGNDTGIFTTLAAGFVLPGRHIVLLAQTPYSGLALSSRRDVACQARFS
jgi:hypothetical protein